LIDRECLLFPRRSHHFRLPRVIHCSLLQLWNKGDFSLSLSFFFFFN
jgi:hypothetical protein